MTDEQQEDTSYKIAQEVAGVFFVLSAYAIGLCQSRLPDEVALLVVLREDIQDALRVLLGGCAIPDKRKFTSCDDTQRWHFYHRTPKFLHIGILERSSVTNACRQWRQLDRCVFS